MNAMPYHLSKKPVTLLEVLIAMTLTIAILMTLTYFYRQIEEINQEVDRIIVANFSMRYVENRLADILPKSISETDKKQDFVFFSIGDEGIAKPGSQSLIFTFDNRISLDKPFSNHVLGRLFVDKDGKLMLAYWPSPKRWEPSVLPPMKKEVLLEGVENLAFEFFIAPDKGEKKAAKEGQQVPEPKGEWRRQFWLKEFQQLPAMVKVIVTLSKDNRVLTFAFPMANADAHPIYE